MVQADMLSGVLTGGAFGTGVHGPYRSEHRSGAGHLMIALDVAAFQPLAEFGARIERFIAELKAVPPAPGFTEVFYPARSRRGTRPRTGPTASSCLPTR